MKTLNINCPEGYEINQEKSDLSKGIIEFKEIKKVISYEDVANKLFGIFNYYIGADGSIEKDDEEIYYPNCAKTRDQLQSILSLNKLCNVAKYLNGDWLPDFSSNKQEKYSINICDDDIIRRNAIAFCLKNWKLIDVEDTEIEPHNKFIFVLSHDNKENWCISHKFNFRMLEQNINTN